MENISEDHGMKEEWQFIEDPISRVMETNGLLDEGSEGTDRTEKTVQKANKALSAERKDEIDRATSPPKDGVMDWSDDSVVNPKTKKTPK